MCDQQKLRPACAYAQTDQSLCSSLEYSMNVERLTKQHVEFLSLKGGCTSSSESTLVKIPHCWKSRVAAQIGFKKKFSFPSCHAVNLQVRQLLCIQKVSRGFYLRETSRRFDVQSTQIQSKLPRPIPRNQTSDVNRGSTLIT